MNAYCVQRRLHISYKLKKVIFVGSFSICDLGDCIFIYTLGSGISVPPGINVPPGIFDKRNKRAPWKIDFSYSKIAIYVAYEYNIHQKIKFSKKITNLRSEIRSVPPGKMFIN